MESQRRGIKQALKGLTPPFLWRAGAKLALKRAIKSDSIIYYTESSLSWEELVRQGNTYFSENILERCVDAHLKVASGGAAFSRDGVVFHEPEYSWPLISGALLSAAENAGNISVLDFGGGLATSYYQHKILLSEFRDLHWTVVEQAAFVEYGSKHLTTEALSFQASVKACLRVERVSFILCSAVLHYLENPLEILESFGESQARYLFIDRTPVHEGNEDILTIQNVPESIYRAKYPAWAFARAKLMEALAGQWELIQEFETIDGVQRTPQGTELTFVGLLLKRKA